MNWIVYQGIIFSETENDNKKTINMGIAVRNVVAETREEAIGKFYIDTKDLKAKSRIDPIECFELSKLKTI